MTELTNNIFNPLDLITNVYNILTNRKKSDLLIDKNLILLDICVNEKAVHFTVDIFNCNLESIKTTSFWHLEQLIKVIYQ